MLNEPTTQEAFGQLVGISQPAVSELLARGVLTPGTTAGEWLRLYCSNLREQAAGRGADGELAHQRAEESRTRKELLQIRLAERRKEVAAVALIEQVLAHVGRKIRGALEPLHVTLKMRLPQLTAEDLKVVEAEVAVACNLAVTVSLQSLADVAAEDDAAGD